MAGCDWLHSLAARLWVCICCVPRILPDSERPCMSTRQNAASTIHSHAKEIPLSNPAMDCTHLEGCGGFLLKWSQARLPVFSTCGKPTLPNVDSRVNSDNSRVSNPYRCAGVCVRVKAAFVGSHSMGFECNSSGQALAWGPYFWDSYFTQTCSNPRIVQCLPGFAGSRNHVGSLAVLKDSVHFFDPIPSRPHSAGRADRLRCRKWDR